MLRKPSSGSSSTESLPPVSPSSPPPVPPPSTMVWQPYCSPSGTPFSSTSPEVMANEGERSTLCANADSSPSGMQSPSVSLDNGSPFNWNSSRLFNPSSSGSRDCSLRAVPRTAAECRLSPYSTSHWSGSRSPSESVVGSNLFQSSSKEAEYSAASP